MRSTLLDWLNQSSQAGFEVAGGFSVVTRGLTKSFSRGPVLSDINLEIPPGQFVALLGKNGAGKSTLMRLLAGHEMIDDGAIEHFGSNIEFENVHRRQRIAYISENVQAGVTTDLKTLIRIYRSIYPKWSERLFTDFFTSFRLEERFKFGELSRGQRVQFLFSAAAASRVDLYLLDEVTSVLDAHSRFKAVTFLTDEVARGATVLMATNIASEIQGHADHVLFIADQKVLLDCPSSDLQTLFTKFRVPAGSVYDGAADEIRPVHVNDDGSTSYLTPRGTRLGAAVESDKRAVTIEDVYIYFTGPGEKA